MRYYSENTVKGLLKQLDAHFVKYLESLPSIEIKEPHGRCVDIDRMISDGRSKSFPIDIQSSEDLADFLEIYADLDKTDNTVVLEASAEGGANR